MASTKHVSFRMPEDVFEALRKEALECERSVSWVIVRKLVDSKVRSASAETQVDFMASVSRCTHSGHVGFQRADGYWCQTCAKMYR